MDTICKVVDTEVTRLAYLSDVEKGIQRVIDEHEKKGYKLLSVVSLPPHKNRDDPPRDHMIVPIALFFQKKRTLL